MRPTVEDEIATRQEMSKADDPKATEQRIHEARVESGHLTPEIDHSRRPFVIIMPPPT